MAVRWYEAQDDFNRQSFLLMQPVFLRYSTFFEETQIEVLRAGIDTCEVETVWFSSSDANLRVAGDLTMTIDGYPPVVAAQLGTGGEYDTIDLKELIDDPWGRTVSWSAPGDTIPGFDLPAAARFPAGLIELTSPVPGADELVPRDALTIRWNGLGSDPLWVYIDGVGYSVFCLVADDGEFTVPESALSHAATSSDPGGRQASGGAVLRDRP